MRRAKVVRFCGSGVRATARAQVDTVASRGAALRFGTAECQDESRCSAIHSQRPYQPLPGPRERVAIRTSWAQPFGTALPKLPSPIHSGQAAGIALRRDSLAAPLRPPGATVIFRSACGLNSRHGGVFVSGCAAARDGSLVLISGYFHLCALSGSATAASHIRAIGRVRAWFTAAQPLYFPAVYERNDAAGGVPAPWRDFRSALTNARVGQAGIGIFSRFERLLNRRDSRLSRARKFRV